MLVGNGARLASNPSRLYGGAALYTVNNPNWMAPGAARSGLVGFGSTTRGDASKKFLASKPNGYGVNGWLMPFTAGAISTFNEANGAGEFSGAGALGVNIEGASAGAAVIAATGQLVVSAIASIAGLGGVEGTVRAALLAAAALAGAGDFAGALDAIGHAVSGMSGAGSISGANNATGRLAGAIDIGASGELTAGGIASELLDEQLVETGLTVRETLRLCVAALAGKVSGAGGTTITFRSAEADHKDRIVAIVDSNGNRSTVTLDASD